MKYLVNSNFEDAGDVVRVEITIPYTDLQTVHDIRNCNSCPVGYRKYDCGRRQFFDSDQTKNTCKLNKLSMSDLLRMVADQMDADRSK